ncbi:integration host factor subunit beta [Spirosoma sp. HMF4905]|uniref:Integration host factor subunit beta n=2 Tax=Spirosoma arboris TaxID=2682092 RepID=A0A7K1SR73_9BACT|nr:integration host factor subunit beta [Spirosoma arboris]
MTKQDLLRKITDQTGLDPQISQTVVEAFFDSIKEALIDGEPIYVRGFGSFVLKHRAPKKARNISQQTTVLIDAHSIPHFKPSASFVKRVREGE